MTRTTKNCNSPKLVGIDKIEARGNRITYRLNRRAPTRDLYWAHELGIYLVAVRVAR